MSRVPLLLADALARAQTTIRVATRILKAARHREVETLDRLRAAGVSSAEAALVVAKAEGEPASVADRRRIAGRLRQRRYRVTHRNRELRAPSPRAVLPPLPSTVRKEVDDMPQLIKRTTEEFLLDDDELLASDEEETDEDEESDEDPEPRRPKRIAGRK